MSLGRAPAGVIGAPGPSAPTSRPLWLLVLSSITLMQGGLTLVSGLSILRDPVEANRLPPALSRPLTPDEEAQARELTASTGQIIARHSVALRGFGAASIVVSLLMLYAAAAALSRDRHGRRAMLIAAWVGIACRIGALPINLSFTSEVAEANAPIRLRFAAAKGGPGRVPDGGSLAAAARPTAAATARDGAATASTVSTGDGSPPVAGGQQSDPPIEAPGGDDQNDIIAGALLGVVGSLLLIVYFGGRRGRALYGLPPRLG